MNTLLLTREVAPTIESTSVPTEMTTMATKTTRSPKETVGQRLARLRRERGLTQVEMAQKLDVAQPVISGYERDELRLHGKVIVELTKILHVSADELLGLQEPKAGLPVKNRRLLRRIQELERLPKRDQQAVLRTIDAFLAKAS